VGGERDPVGLVNPGDVLGPSRWVDIDQDRIDRFASATEDSQWILPVDGGNQARIAATVEREGHEKPVCVADLVFRFVR
jgi:hypothetical protein